MSDIVLYGDPRSTYVRTARMTCREKRVAYSLEPADLASEAYRKMHPFGRMPAMRHGDLTMFETSAITRYIDEAFEGPRLQPDDTVERARMNQWISAINHYFYSDVIRRYLMQYFFASEPDGAPDMAAIEAALPDVRHHLEALDGALEGRTFIAAERVSLADLFLAPILFYVGKMPEGPDLLAPLANLRRWIDAMAARSSFTETVPQMARADAAE